MIIMEPFNTLTIKEKALTIGIPTSNVIDWFTSNLGRSVQPYELILYDTTEYIIREYIWQAVYDALDVGSLGSVYVGDIPGKKTRARKKKI